MNPGFGPLKGNQLDGLHPCPERQVFWLDILGTLPKPARPSKGFGASKAFARRPSEKIGRPLSCVKPLRPIFIYIYFYRGPFLLSSKGRGRMLERRRKWKKGPFYMLFQGESAVGQNLMASHFGVGEFTTHFRTYFSGDWDVHWGYGILTHGQSKRHQGEKAHVFCGPIFERPKQRNLT